MYEDIHMALCRGRKCINASHCMVSGATCLHTHPALDYFMTHSIHAYESMVASTAAATVVYLQGVTGYLSASTESTAQS